MQRNQTNEGRTASISKSNQLIGVFGRYISLCIPIARWAETGVEGSTLVIRLQRPFVIVQEFQKEALYIRMMFKISYLSILII